MRLVFLGTTGYHPNERRHTACVMLPELGMILDAGTGFFRVRDHVQTTELLIFLSHAHVDHVVGLTYLLDVIDEKPVQRVVLYGAQKHLMAVRDHLFHELIFPVKIHYELHAVDQLALLPSNVPHPSSAQPHASADHPNSGGIFPIPGGGVGHVRWQQHEGGSLGYRFAWGAKSLAYITDTPATPENAAFIRGVDVLIHECYFPDAQKERAALTQHSYAGAVAEAARCAGVGRLFLVHTNPMDDSDDPVGLAGMRTVFPQTYLAEDRMEVEF